MRTFLIVTLATIAMSHTLAKDSYKKRSLEEDHEAMGHLVDLRSVASAVYRRSLTPPRRGQSYMGWDRKRRSPEEDHEAMGHSLNRRSVASALLRRSVTPPRRGQPYMGWDRKRRSPEEELALTHSKERSPVDKVPVPAKVNGEPIKVEGKSFGMGGMGYGYGGYGGGYGGYPYYRGYYG